MNTSPRVIVPWLKEPVVSEPSPMETTIISRAQSILTTTGVPGPRLPYEQALDIVRWAERTPIQ